MRHLSEAIGKKVNESMDIKKLFSIVDEMKEALGAETLLDDLCQALSAKELEDNLRYIDNMRDLGIF